MKSNIRKNTNDENENGSIKGVREVPNNIYLIQTVKPLVQKDFDEAIKEMGEDAGLEIIRYMLSTRYLRRFLPQTVEVKSAVKSCVSALVRRVSMERLGKSLKIDEIQSKTDAELNIELKKLKEIKKSMGNSSKSGVDKLMASYKTEIEAREKVKMEKENAEKEKTLREAKAIEDKKLAEQKEKAKEVQFYETVKAYTKNFSFLSDSEEFYFSISGGQNSVKFQSLDEYSRYAELKRILNFKISKNNISEEQAISSVLADKNLNLKVADRKILLERQSVIEKQKSKEER